MRHESLRRTSPGRPLTIVALAASAVYACGGDDSPAAVDAGNLPDVGAFDAPHDGFTGSDGTTGDAPSGSDASPYDSGGYDSSYDSGGFDASGGSPRCDGIVELNEYGSAGNQVSAPPSETWYMTWDAQNLYLAITSAKTTEAAIVYLSADLGAPDAGTDASTDAGADGASDGAVDGAADAGSDAAASDAGAIAGKAYDNTRLAHIGFTPKLVVYAKDSYNEYRTTDDTGAWGAAQTGKLQFCAAGTTREIVMPWSYLTGGARPASFDWVGYLTSAAGFVYGQVPTDNPGGAIGLSAIYPHYYAVGNTAVSAPFTNEQSN